MSAPTLTKSQQEEAWKWFCAKREIGTFKSQAKKMGISGSQLWVSIKNMRDREGRAK